MKQKYILCVVGLSVLLFSGCGQQQSQMEYKETEEAKQLSAEDSLNTSTDAYNTLQPTQSAWSDPQSSADSTAVDITGVDADAVMLTAEEAETKALDHAGVTSDTVTFVKNKLDYEDGRWVYDVEFYSNDYTEYDYEIDAYTGEVISYDHDAEDYALPTSSDGSSMITAEEAKELALAKVSGAAAGDIREFEIDYEDGHTEYEGLIIYNGMEYEFEIDAYSGVFRSWEEEPVDR